MERHGQRVDLFAGPKGHHLASELPGLPDTDEGRVLQLSADQTRIRVCEDRPVPIDDGKKGHIPAVLLGHQRLERRALPRVRARASAANSNPMLTPDSGGSRPPRAPPCDS